MSDSKNDHQVQLMRAAIDLALQSIEQGGGPFGSVVVKDGVIVGRGQNNVTTANDPTAHAEVVAIREACRELKTFSLAGCELFTSCEPCPMCLGAILWARIDRVWYASTRQDAAAGGFDDSAFYAEAAKPIDQRDLPMRPLLRDEAQAAFTAWKAAQAKTHY